MDFVIGYADRQSLLTNGGKIPVSCLRGQSFSKAALRRMREDKL